jgi:uncharacterized membrane protein YbhN (UPF0104 family)
LKQQISKWLSILLPIFLGVFLIVYTYQKFTPGQILEIKSYFKNANYSYIVLGIFIAFLGNASRAYRWKFMLEHLGYKTSFYNNFMAVNICYLLNLSVPKSGEISRAVILKKYENVPFDKGFGTIVAERIVDMIVLLTFMLAAFFMQFRIVKEFILDKIPMQKLLVFASVATVVGVGLLLVYLYSKLPWILASETKSFGAQRRRDEHRTHGKENGIFATHDFHLVLLPRHVLHDPFCHPRNELAFHLGATVTAFVVGSIAIAFTNSGFGSYPFLISKILLVYGIAETAGNAFGWIVWTSQMLLVVVLGVLSFLLLPVFNRSK